MVRAAYRIGGCGNWGFEMMAKLMRTVVVVDSHVADRAGLLAGLSHATPIAVVLPTEPAIPAVRAILANQSAVDRLVIIAHGAPGVVRLGTGLDVSTALDHGHALAQWRSHLAPGATIQILACEAGAGDEGQRLVTLLAALTGVPVAAASRVLDGQQPQDWELDVGTPGADLASRITPRDWAHQLSWSPGPSNTPGNDVFTGSVNADNASGGAGNDLLNGNDGNDWLAGDSGQDTVVGGIGDDTIRFNSVADITAGESADGGAGLDRLELTGSGLYDFWTNSVALTGFETLFVVGANSTVTGGLAFFGGLSNISGSTGTQSLIFRTAGSFDWSSISISSIEVFDFSTTTSLRLPASYATAISVSGSAGADSVVAGAMADSLGGSSGNDTLIGNDGNDTLAGSGGADSLVGGAGNDVMPVFSGETFIGDVFDGGTGDDTIEQLLVGALNITNLSLVSVERLQAISSGGMSLTLTSAQAAGFSTIQGGVSIDEIIISDGGADFTGKTLTSIEQIQTSVGTGVAITLPTGYATPITVLGANGNDTLIGSVGNNWLLGIFGSDSLSGGDGADTIDGGENNDTMTGGTGADVFLAGNVVDFNGDVITDFSPGDIIDSSATFFNFVVAGNGTAMGINSVEVKHDGGNTLVYVNDSIGAAADATITLTGFIPLDEFSISGGNLARAAPVVPAAITGSSLALAGSYGSVSTVSLSATGVATITQNSASVTPSGAPNLGITTVSAAAMTGAFGVVLQGFSNAESLVGSSAADTLDCASGNDTLLGGAGGDSLRGGLNVDSVMGEAGNDTIGVQLGDTAFSEVWNGGADTDTLQLMGAGGYDFSILTLTSLEVLAGTSGDDTVTLLPSQIGQFTSVNLGGGTDIIVLKNVSGSLDLSSIPFSGVEFVRVSPSAAILITDSAGVAVEIDANNILSHTVAGSAGDDLIFGGTGSDSITGGDGADTIDGHQGADILAGGAGVDWIFGGPGADSINGGGQADNIIAGVGDDSITHAGAGEVIFAGEGADVISVGTSGAVGVLIVGDTNLADIFNDLAAGGAGADTMFGCGGNDTLFGYEDADMLLGNDGNDSIEGGTGNDTLWGGAGNDWFVFPTNDGSTDLIADFTVGQDKLAFYYGNFASAQILAVNGGMQVTMGTTIILLAGVNSLSVTDFLFIGA
ncbi:MAG: DUF4347 domain-containing protein [Alphaproteobacteria bacterium]|nr:DUF4347 domain-containing protein [Alphaproteobacteria bacterium]